MGTDSQRTGVMIKEVFEQVIPHCPEEKNPYTEIIRSIAGKQTQSGRLLITIDGPCASGKTTMAQKLAGLFDAPVVHTDDYVIPHAQKMEKRLAIPGGNCDVNRFVREVAAPWKRGDPVKYRRYDCRKDVLLPEEELPGSRILILEGSYSNLPEIREYADIRIFANAPWEIREERLRRRESSQSLKMFHDRWIPLENHYFEAFGLPDQECILVDTSDGADL